VLTILADTCSQATRADRAPLPQEDDAQSAPSSSSSSDPRNGASCCRGGYTLAPEVEASHVEKTLVARLTELGWLFR